MNLYGDLPPAQDGSDAVVASTSSGAGWSTSTYQNSVTASSAITNAKAKPTSKPPTLAFKPRQTSVQSTTKAASYLVGSSSESKSTETFREKHTVPAVQHDGLVSTMSAVAGTTTGGNSFGKEELNVNSGFDVLDAYDPSVPNEYIAYCEERLERRKAQRVEEDNRRVMQEAETAREQLEKERRDASLRGDYQSLLMLSAGSAEEAGSLGSGAGVGRGRGRGLTNLPAWMTQQLGSGASEKDAPAVGEEGRAEPPASGTAVAAVGVKRRQQAGQVNKPSCVLLLKNMVGPGEEDDQLGPETQQECQRYGPVRSCVVHVVPALGEGCPEHERVRTFVEFDGQEGAVRAVRDMHGRFFGGRQIAASFFPEDRFQRGDLAPDVSERAAWS